MDLNNINNQQNINNNFQTTNQNSNNEDTKTSVKSIFDMCLRRYKQTLDKNQDGTISIDEVQEFVQSQDSNQTIILKIATILGIETDNNVLSFLKSKINTTLNNFKIADTNNDNSISYEEAMKMQSQLQGEVKDNFNKACGIIDGDLTYNKQGKYGTCWALTAIYGLSVKRPDLLKNMIKQDKNGDIIVTFKNNIMNDDNTYKPYQCKISRIQIISAIMERTEAKNNKIFGIDSKNVKYHTSDPDAIAIELALQKYSKYQEQEISNYKKKEPELLKQYIELSSPKQIEKPNIENWSSNMSDLEKDKLYTYFVEIDSRDNKDIIKALQIIQKDTKYTMDEIAFLKKCYNEIQPKQIKKPSLDGINWADPPFEIYDYVYNKSTCDKIKIPQEPKFGYNIGSFSENEGGKSERALFMMIDSKFEKLNYQDKELNENDKKDVIEHLNKASNKNLLYSVSFKKNDNTVHSNHAYYIENFSNGKVFLKDPHDETLTVEYPIKFFLQNINDLMINNIT